MVVKSTGSGGRCQLLHIVGAQLTVATPYYYEPAMMRAAVGSKYITLKGISRSPESWSGAKLAEGDDTGDGKDLGLRCWVSPEEEVPHRESSWPQFNSVMDLAAPCQECWEMWAFSVPVRGNPGAKSKQHYLCTGVTSALCLCHWLRAL